MPVRVLGANYKVTWYFADSGNLVPMITDPNLNIDQNVISQTTLSATDPPPGPGSLIFDWAGLLFWGALALILILLFFTFLPKLMAGRKDVEG